MAANRSEADKAKMKMACFVIIFAMLGWMGATALGGAFGLPTRFAFLFDLAAMAAFVWSLYVLWQVWRSPATEDR